VPLTGTPQYRLSEQQTLLVQLCPVQLVRTQVPEEQVPDCNLPQHFSGGTPQSTHVPLEQAFPLLQFPPVQQGWVVPPQATQVPLEQTPTLQNPLQQG
jgi:hypothetical protein